MLSLESIKNSTIYVLHNSKIFALITVILSTLITSVFLNLIPGIAEPIKLLCFFFVIGIYYTYSR